VRAGRVLENGFTAWEGDGLPVDRGAPRWELERQVRLVAGSVVLSSILGGAWPYPSDGHGPCQTSV